MDLHESLVAEKEVFPLIKWLLFHVVFLGHSISLFLSILNDVYYKEIEISIIYLGIDGFLHLISYVCGKI